MTTLTIQVPDEFKIIVSDSIQMKRITSYFVEDYLAELYQDNKTKIELENNLYDTELNNKLKLAV